MTASGYKNFIAVNLETKEEADVMASVILNTGLLLMGDDKATDKDKEAGYQLVKCWHNIKEATTFK